MTFPEVLLETARNTDFVREYDRLRGTSLSKLGGRSVLDTMIDQATGHQDTQVKRFVEDVYDLIWCRLPR